ncbi:MULTISPECIES: hypothetical protein [Bacteroidales]|uniref:Pectate lyase superfamily protein domain-containing protein n=1 Tax=Coprobacter secundus subsp. similis TaxID=2751153 RepID=A0A7G1HW12_9BACT|nr:MULTISPECIES: hypothetical protein [Bacteroidales]BCI62992.1 hypothetical protein Cop2CBH44_13450 [Coprobacter secundus subsp. similis]
MKKLLIIIGYCCLTIGIIRAQIIKTDFFDGLSLGSEIEQGEYNSVVQDGTNPIKANQWNLTGRDDIQYFRSGSSPVIAGKLFYPNYPPSNLALNAIRLSKLSSGGRMSVYSLTAGNEYVMQPYYLAFMLKVEDISSLPDDNNNDFISFDGNYSGNHLRGRLILRKTKLLGKFALALGGYDSGIEQTTEYDVGETLLVVLKYNFFTSDRSVSLFINPDLDEEEPKHPDLKLDFTGTDMLGQIRGISVRQSSFYALMLGGLRFSDNWDDVIGKDSGDIISGYSTLVNIGVSGKLDYNPDPQGYYLPDYSYAGYRNGEKKIPVVPVVKTISPVSGDNTAHIQAAIDEVGRRNLDVNGFRGALLLQAGKYEVKGTLYVKYSGVVLRGVGNGTDESNSTIIYATGDIPHQRNVMILGYPSQDTWNNIISGTQRNITDELIPVGAREFSVTDSSPYSVGDQIVIYHPCTSQWLQAVDFGGVPAPQDGMADERWREGELPIVFNRFITSIEGNKIVIDAPIYYTLNKSLSQSYIYKYDRSNILTEIGLENLRIDIENAGGEDENHAWSAVRFKSADYCWAKNVIVKGFGLFGISVECVTRSTVDSCQAIEPVSIITGERRYNFNAGNNSQLVLFKNCYANKGRHSYVSNGTSSVSGIVFLNCISDRAVDVSESHRKWSQGLLYDNYREQNLSRNFVLGLYNRVDMGTGHGWSAVQSVLWNCDVTARGVIGLQKPPTSQNYAIGCKAGDITGRPLVTSEYVSDFLLGFVESKNMPIESIPSLYLAQLNDRLNNTTSCTSCPDGKSYTFTRDGQTVIIHFDDDIRDGRVAVYTLDGKYVFTQQFEGNSVRVKMNKDNVYLLRISGIGFCFVEKAVL